MKFIAVSFIIWRLLLFIPVQFLTPQGSTNFPWANFDGAHYVSIAFDGYTFDGRFFPLYPVLIKIFSLPFNSWEAYSYVGFFIANLFFILALMLFYNLVASKYSKDIAQQSVIWMLI